MELWNFSGRAERPAGNPAKIGRLSFRHGCDEGTRRAVNSVAAQGVQILFIVVSSDV